MVMRIITFKAPEELVEVVDKIAVRTGKSRSVLIREALELLVKKYSHILSQRERETPYYKPRVERVKVR